MVRSWAAAIGAVGSVWARVAAADEPPAGDEHPPQPTDVTSPLPPAPTPASADLEPKDAPARRPSYLATDIAFWSSLSLAGIHFTDHVVRNNHSFWPFNEKVTPGTFFLFFVPAVYGTSLAVDAGPLYWTVASSVLLVGVGLVHTLIEPPSHQVTPWENGSNLLEAESRGIGYVAVGVTYALVGSIATQLVLNVKDGLEYGFTWKRRRSIPKAAHPARLPVVQVGQAPRGGTVGVTWAF